MTDYSNASHGGLLGEVDMKGDWEGGRKQKEGIRVSPSCATSLPSSSPPSHLHQPNCFLNYLKQSFVFNYFCVKGNEVFSFRKIDVSIGLLSAESSMNYCECKKYCLMIICGNRVTSYHLKWHLSGNSTINVAMYIFVVCIHSGAFFPFCFFL